MKYYDSTKDYRVEELQDKANEVQCTINIIREYANKDTTRVTPLSPEVDALVYKLINLRQEIINNIK